jgi:hypothetical protein
LIQLIPERIHVKAPEFYYNNVPVATIDDIPLPVDTSNFIEKLDSEGNCTLYTDNTLNLFANDFNIEHLRSGTRLTFDANGLYYDAATPAKAGYVATSGTLKDYALKTDIPVIDTSTFFLKSGGTVTGTAIFEDMVYINDILISGTGLVLGKLSGANP